MVKLWCISDDNGESLRCQSEGHWHKSRDGVAVLEATPVAAICAYLATAEARHPRELPPTCRLMSVTVGDGYIEEASPRKDWADNLIATQASGNAWLARGVAPVLRVPGLSGAAQYLFNTRHSLSSRCRVKAAEDDAVATYAGNLMHVLEQGTDWLATPLPTQAAASVQMAAGAD
jgi:hypothetical protein